jgi:hypothetical protein
MSFLSKQFTMTHIRIPEQRQLRNEATHMGKTPKKEHNQLNLSPHDHNMRKIEKQKVNKQFKNAPYISSTTTLSTHLQEDITAKEAPDDFIKSVLSSVTVAAIKS